MYGNEHGDRDGGEDGSGNGNKNRYEGGGEREPWNLRSGNRDGLEDARRGATPTNNQQPQPQDPTPQLDRHIMRRTRAQGREPWGRNGEGGGEAKKRKKPQKSCWRHLKNGEDLSGRRKNRSQGSTGSVDVDPEDLDSRKETEKDAQGTQGLCKNCRESPSCL